MNTPTGSLRIDDGQIRLAINDDPDRLISFNPSDVGFAEKFYKLVAEFEARFREYLDRSEKLESNTDLDANGLPANAPERLALLNETCAYVREKIDYLFGAGTSQKAFGDEMVLGQFSQFFAGITPYLQKARAPIVEKYLSQPANKKPAKKRRRS
jgi:hypothetical protein